MPIVMTTWGDPTADQLLRYAELGIDRAVLGAGRADWEDPTTALPFVERYADLVPELAG